MSNTKQASDKKLGSQKKKHLAINSLASYTAKRTEEIITSALAGDSKSIRSLRRLVDELSNDSTPDCIYAHASSILMRAGAEWAKIAEEARRQPMESTA